MARKNKKKNMKNVQETRPVRRPNQPEIVYGRVPSGVPVAKPASNIQLTPIVQPVAFVPYSTESQPILTLEEEYEDYDEY